MSWPIKLDRSIIWAADVSDIDVFDDILAALEGVEGLEAVKVGLSLVDRYSLGEVVGCLHDVGLKAIWDRQKGGTDIPDMGKIFAELALEAEVDAVILFPLTGPSTQLAWTQVCIDLGVPVIVGGDMTHENFRGDIGYIRDEAPARIYTLAAKMGVRDFVVPGNRPMLVEAYRELVEGITGGPVTLHAPGFVDQGGKVTEAGKVAGEYFHAIVGRGISTAEDPRAAVEELASQLG